MVKAAIFDMFETLVTLFEGRTYFSENIAEDLNIPLSEFRNAWHATERDRTIGKYTMEEGLALSLKSIGRYTPEAVRFVLNKRAEALGDTFHGISTDIMEMLENLKARGIKIGLISNCFSDEFEWIRKSPLYPFFDAPMLSYEQRASKPDPEIYLRTINKLGVKPEECLYIGDGGSRELFTARDLGMKALQALYFHSLAFEPHVPCKVLEEFEPILHPSEVMKYL